MCLGILPAAGLVRPVRDGVHRKARRWRSGALRCAGSDSIESFCWRLLGEKLIALTKRPLATPATQMTEAALEVALCQDLVRLSEKGRK